MKYLILTAVECNEMQELVQDAMSQGYEPFGGLAVGKYYNGEDTLAEDLLYQTMIDYEGETQEG